MNPSPSIATWLRRWIASELAVGMQPRRANRLETCALRALGGRSAGRLRATRAELVARTTTAAAGGLGARWPSDAAEALAVGVALGRLGSWLEAAADVRTLRVGNGEIAPKEGDDRHGH